MLDTIDLRDEPSSFRSKILSSTLTLLSATLLVASNVGQTSANQDTISMVYLPLTMRSEGRLKVSYYNEKGTTKHHYAFTESIDSITKRSRVSIGLVSYDPKEYVSWGGASMIRLDDKGRCIKNEQANSFVPELDWIAKWVYTDTELTNFFNTNTYANGPSGFIRLFRQIHSNLRLTHSTTVEHRNIDCAMYSGSCVQGKSSDVKVHIYIPYKTYFNVSKVPIFSFSEKFAGIQQDGGPNFTVEIEIDYFNIQAHDDEKTQSDKMMGDFNLPLGHGCSEIVPNFVPSSTYESFMMAYYQQSAMTHVLVAYDHDANYLRKEMFGETVSIWDLKQDLLYHIDPHAMSSKQVSLFDNRQFDAQQCAVLQVTDTKLGPSFRPYEKEQISSPILEFLGIDHLAYIGLGRVRDFPTVVYETVSGQPPKLFGLDSIAKDDYDFITQFHMLDHNDGVYFSKYTADMRTFWPIRITLYKREKSTNTIKMIDILEVNDFHTGLMGWEKKPGELFMASECYSNEYEQVRIELSIDFNSDTDSVIKTLARNKYKLELDMIEDIFRTLNKRRINLIEYELNIRPHNIVMNMVIGDTQTTKSLYKYGDNEIPVDLNPKWEEHSIVFNGLVEQECVSQAALIKDTVFLVYCPYTFKTQSLCRAYVQEMNFATMPRNDTNKPPEEQCQYYGLNYDYSPQPATADWMNWRDKLRNHEMKFNLIGENDEFVNLKAIVQDVDVTREMELEKVINYKFSLDDDHDNSSSVDAYKRKLRYFESIRYKTVGDCSKMCNLDAHCRSYSYCSPKKNEQIDKNSPVCILSSLDLRASEVNSQLSASVASDSIKVKDVSNEDYTLKLSPSCNIYERDYLNIFTPTDEIIQLDESLAKQLPSQASSFDCAKAAVDLEASHPDHHVAMFAYCAYSGTCLLDENMFTPTNGTSADEPDPQDVQDNKSPDNDNSSADNKVHELPCNVYRRRYQSYFKVSAHVLKPQDTQQVKLNFNSVEECARACWNQFGHVCGSFDYCWPSSCYVNQVVSDDDLNLSKDKLEIRSDCLHYDRDLALDRLRAEHLIGRHRILDMDSLSGGSTFFRFIFNVFLFSIMLVSFVVGLIIGRQVSDRLENVTIVRQSFSAGSSGLRRVSQAFIGAWNNRFGGGGASGGGLSSGSENRDAANLEGNSDMQYYSSNGLSSAIQLEEFKSSVIPEEDEDQPDDVISGHLDEPKFGPSTTQSSNDKNYLLDI